MIANPMKENINTTKIDEDNSVRLRAGNSSIYIPYSNDFRVAAVRWSKVVRNRVRWSKFEDQERNHGDLIQKELNNLANCSTSQLHMLADAGHVSVEIPNNDEMITSDFNRYPWEYALSAATKKSRTSRRLTVIRSIGDIALHNQCIKKILYVQITPVDTRRAINFDTEQMLISEHLALPRVDEENNAWHLDFLNNPSKQELARYIAHSNPDIIHIAGISTAAARHLFEIEKPLPNGMLSSASLDNNEIIEYEELADILCSSSRRKPVLIFANLLRTSTMFSAACLRNGAGSVLSISNSIDSSIIYKFITSFYRRWREDSFESLLTSFQSAYLELASGSGELRGTAIVLNSAAPLIDNPTWPGKTESDYLQVEGDPIPVSSLEVARAAIAVKVEPEGELNYASLHNAPKNEGCLFREFNISNSTNADIAGVHVEVELHFGSERFPYRQSFTVEAKDTRSIKNLVQVPLTAALIREVRESVKTSLYVKVAYMDFSVYEHTYDVVLLPANEWKDTKLDGVWLPSFVLPRDPAVEEVVSKATRYLKAILDEPTAGFSGYVRLENDRTNQIKIVDRQVSAIWSALLYEYSLDYISPPPTYTKRSQRLRTPSQVIRSQSGTCIDLVLLLAACLEHVDIHACVVVLKGHAQLAYWSNEQSYAKFVSGMDATATSETIFTGPLRSEQVSSQDEEPIAPWIITNSAEVIGLVRKKSLVIVETVNLTKKIGFSKSRVPLSFWSNQQKNLFRALVDVQHARKSQITPLPLIDYI